MRPLKELLEEPWLAQATDGEWHYNEKDLDMISLYKMPSYLNGNSYAETLFEMSSLLPLRYNEDIGKHLNDERSGRHVAMGVNADATTLIKLMDIGTPTNIIQNK